MKDFSVSLTDYAGEQLLLDLLPPRSFATLCNEEGIHNLSIHCNSRLTRSWHVTINRFTGTRELHIPAVFETAPEPIKKTLLQWATMQKITGKLRSPAQRIIKRDLETKLFSYLTGHTVSRKREPITKQIWTTQGTVYDLKEVFSSLNTGYFNNLLNSFLRWGTSTSRTSFQMTRKDSTGDAWHYITIAGIYNHPQVPRFAIESIMYHEMLHIHIPPRTECGRRIVHGPDFRKMEQAFPHYREWRNWEKMKVPGILASLIKIRKKNRR